MASLMLRKPGLILFMRGMQDLGSLTRNETHAPCVEARSPNHWAAREFPLTPVWKELFACLGLLCNL